MTQEDEVKTETQEVNATELEKKIIKQLEYYFGDFNLHKDKFLKSQSQLDDGWLPLKTMITFNRLKELSTDLEVIANAISKSTSGLIEVSEDKTKIRRSPQKPLPSEEEIKKRIELRTFNVKRFPEDTKLDQLLEFFSQYANVDNVYMKRFNTKKFRGSVFVTFATDEDAEKFKSVETLKFNDTILTVETKEEYSKRKQEESEKRKSEKSKSHPKDTKVEEEEIKEEDLVRGALIRLKGLGEDVKWDSIKALFTPHAEVAYVDHSAGQSEALVRLKVENTAKEALEKALTGEGDDKKLILNGKEITAEIVEGDEETELLIKSQKMRKALNRDRFNKKKGKFKGHKRSAEDHSSAPKPKHTKFEE